MESEINFYFLLTKSAVEWNTESARHCSSHTQCLLDHLRTHAVNRRNFSEDEEALQ